MKVLHLTLSYNHGGRREAIAGLARGLAEDGVESHLGCLDEFGSVPSERHAFAGSFSLERRRLFDMAALGRLRAYCADHGIDVVHAHDAASAAMAALALPARGPVLLMSFHRTRNLETARLRDRLRNALVDLRLGAVVTASVERLRHYIANNYVRPEKVSCIPLGIDLERFRCDAGLRRQVRERLGVADGQWLVGTVGHFGPEKGVDVAIDAFQAFLRSNPAQDARLLILGRGNAEEEARLRSIVEPAFADRIVFAGFQTDPEHWFPGFDLLLHGARDEAFGLVLAEAQACGVPVVAAKVGGIPEVVLAGHTGLLAERPDANLLADRISELLLDETRRERMARQAAEHARHQFSRRRYAGEYLEVYRRLLD